MKKILYLLTTTTLVTAGVYFTRSSQSEAYVPREESKLYDQKHYDADAPTAIEEAFEYYRLITANQETGTVEPWMVASVLDQINSRNDRRMNNPITWEFAGPDDVGGRSRAYIIDRTNPLLRFAGGVSGGLFRSRNGGLTWSAVNPNAENLNVSCMAQTKSGVIFYGTGEGAFVSISGTKDGTPGFAPGGIFVSDDGGETFRNLANTINFGYISSMAADSLNPNRIWAGTQNGLRYSDDKGATWTSVSPQGNHKDIHIASDGTIYSYYGGSAIARSTNGGSSFQTLSIDYGAGAQVTRIRIAVSPQDPNFVYVVAAGSIANNPTQGSNYMVGLYRSTDKGETFTRIQNGGSVNFDPLSQTLTLQGQGNFDLCLTVDPTNKNRAIIGGVQLGEWNNGAARIIGSLFQSPVNPAYVHADKHEFLWDYNTTPPTLIILTDGGMFYSKDLGVTFTESNRNFTTTQFYGVAANQQGHIVGGTQDNGTILVNGRVNTPRGSVRVLGGDGFQTEISRLNPNIIFGESQYGNLRRSVNGGVAFNPIWDNRLAGTGAGTNPAFADFNAQFKLWENDADGTGRLFFCTNDRVWVAVDPLNTTQAPTWYTLADGASGLGGGGRFIDIEYTPDGGTLFVCRGSNLFRIDGINSANFDTLNLPTANSKDSNIIVTNITQGLPGGRTITSINLDPNNPNRALITLGNFNNQTYVFLSNNILDANPTYTNVTGNLPRFPVYDAIISTENPNYFVLATEFGIWASENAGSTWFEQNQGMARVATYIIRQYKWRDWEGPFVYIGTHGNGFFRSNSLLTSARNVKPFEAKNSTSLTVYPNPSNGPINVSLQLPSNQSEVQIKVMDLTGKIVYEVSAKNLTLGGNSVGLNLDHLKSGHYIVVAAANGYKETAKITLIK